MLKTFFHQAIHTDQDLSILVNALPAREYGLLVPVRQQGCLSSDTLRLDKPFERDENRFEYDMQTVVNRESLWGGSNTLVLRPPTIVDLLGPCFLESVALNEPIQRPLPDGNFNVQPVHDRRISRKRAHGEFHAALSSRYSTLEVQQASTWPGSLKASRRIHPCRVTEFFP